MWRACDSGRLHVLLKRVPPLKILELDEVHVGVVPALIAVEVRPFDVAPCLGQGSHGGVIPLPHLEPARDDLVGNLELGPEVGGLDLGHGEVRSEIHPSVRTLDLTPPEGASVGATLEHDFGTGKVCRVVDHNGATLSAGGEILRLMEAVGAEMSDGAQAAAFVRRGRSVRGIFDHFEVVPVREGHDAVHVAPDAGIVNGHDGFGPGCDGGFQLADVHVHRARLDVDHDGRCAEEDEGVDGGDVGEARQDDLVAGPDVDEDGRELEGTRTGGRQEGSASIAQGFLDPCLAVLGELGVSGDAGLLHRSFDVFVLGPDEGGLVEGHHDALAV